MGNRFNAKPVTEAMFFDDLWPYSRDPPGVADEANANAPLMVRHLAKATLALVAVTPGTDPRLPDSHAFHRGDPELLADLDAAIVLTALDVWTDSPWNDCRGG
jgi:hypothetical protein